MWVCLLAEAEVIHARHSRCQRAVRLRSRNFHLAWDVQVVLANQKRRFTWSPTDCLSGGSERNKVGVRDYIKLRPCIYGSPINRTYFFFSSITIPDTRPGAASYYRGTGKYPGIWRKIPGYFSVPRFYWQIPGYFPSNTRVFDSLSNTRVNDS